MQSLMIKVGGIASRGWTAYSQKQFDLSPQWRSYKWILQCIKVLMKMLVLSFGFE